MVLNCIGLNVRIEVEVYCIVLRTFQVHSWYSTRIFKEFTVSLHVFIIHSFTTQVSTSYLINKGILHLYLLYTVHRSESGRTQIFYGSESVKWTNTKSIGKDQKGPTSPEPEGFRERSTETRKVQPNSWNFLQWPEGSKQIPRIFYKRPEGSKQATTELQTVHANKDKHDKHVYLSH